MKIETKCIHGYRHRGQEGAVATPIFQSATFAHPAVGESTGYDYSRLQNPTREAAEKLVASLENAKEALGFSSGMAAMATLMELFKPGDHIIATEDLYGGTIRLFEHISRKNGVEVDFVNTADLPDLQSLIKGNTKAIFVETPTNPMMHVTEIAAVSAMVKAMSKNMSKAMSKDMLKDTSKDILIIVDNTFLTPYFQQPIALGADIVLHSGTKYLSGHNDTLAGFLVVSDESLCERLRFLYKTTGACLSPFDSFLIIRGIKTLALRMEKSQQNAQMLAKWLQTQPNVSTVHYVGLPNHPDYAVSKKQASGFGAMISFEVESEALARQMLERVKLIQFAESLGGVETLITYPIIQTHADVDENEKAARGISNKLLRLSVGIEHIDDLQKDLSQALGV